MESLASETSLFLLISRALHLYSSKQPLLSSVDEFWSGVPSSDAARLAISLLESCQESLESFIENGHQREVSPSPELEGLTTADPDRIYMDGCFDLMHSGHYNAIRQAKSLGKVLVVGVHSDDEISRNKGPPVMNEQERYALVRACKWVDEVVENAPYSPTIELLDQYNCMYAAHGDDLSINESGTDCMSILKRAGRCKIFKRTEGVSTTQIVGKLLLMTRDVPENVDMPMRAADYPDTQFSNKSLMTTSRRISEFSNKRAPMPGEKIVYLDGTFDLFHVGHIETIKKAKELGDYLLVGIHDDQTVNIYKGSNFPIMTVHDRAMCVLSTRDVDEIVIGAPWVVTDDLIRSFNISVVAQGTVRKGDPNCMHFRKGSIDMGEIDPYEVPKRLGIYQELVSAHELDTQDIITRIIDNRMRFFSKFQKTSQREKEYTSTKQYIKEC